MDPAEQAAVAIENLRLAAQAAANAEAPVLVEAINSVDVPAFPLDTSDKAIAVINAVGGPNVGFLADLYHLGKMGEDLSAVLDKYGKRSGTSRSPTRRGAERRGRGRWIRAVVRAAGRTGV